MKPSC